MHQLVKNNDKNFWLCNNVEIWWDKSSKRKILWCKKKTINIVYNVVFSKLVEIKNNSKYLIGYLHKVIRQLVLALPKTSGYVNIFKVKDDDKGKTIILCLST